MFLIPRHNVWGHFWFLPMIFILGVIGKILDRVFTRINQRFIGWLSITILAIITYILMYDKHISGWFSLNDLVSYGWSFCIGVICGIVGIVNYIKKSLLLQSFIGLIVSICIFNISITPLPLKTILVSIFMIYALLCICTYLSTKVNVNRNSIFTQTFRYYILSWPCQAVANVLAERILHLPFSMVLCSQLLFGLLGPTIILYVVNHLEHNHNLKWIQFILGK